MAQLASLQGFQMERILGSYPSKKLIAMVGTLEGKEGKAVVVLDKKAFDPDTIASDVKQGNLDLDFENAEYACYNAELPPALNRLSCSVIHPATEKHIAKYTKEDFQMVAESPKSYAEVTKPYVEREELGKRIAWVYNIIDGEKEVERVLFRDDDADTGFILLPDMKWDQESVSSLYCLAIVTRRDLLSLRSLSAQHLPLLRNILNKGCAELKRRFGVEQHQLRVYLHYQPTFYHLHVHFTHQHSEAPGMEAGRAHLLPDVIDNIVLNPNYYQEKTMHFALRTTLGLFKEFATAGLTVAD
eukprot:CAMPEP_0196745176 /NCGR_PEP_ID=MMETSP1091-20130531/60456_1 /TAXON_ID=302021 /ORGANISM="Rhodomonas sp., Strain CCMP768" /LENGTH=299 /DNA_ID=CAMNT_0042091889 /DNA_START=67 /DNA_END=966 /DNA_ORIENTATION=-